MDTRTKLINAADKCLLEKGCHGTCVKAIAEFAGVNHGLVHHYFGSKEDLFIELLKKYFETIKPDSNLSLKKEEDVIGYLKKSIIPSSRIMLEFRSISTHMPKLRTELISLAIELRRSLMDILYIDEDQACLLTGAVLGVGFHSVLEPDINIEKQIKMIVSLLFNNKT